LPAPLYSLLAWRNLSRRKYRSLSLIVVLAVGIAALLLVASLTNGVENTMGENVHDLLSSDIAIRSDTKNREALFTVSPGVMTHLEGMSGVKAVAPRIEAEGLMNSGDGWHNTSGTLVYGIDGDRDSGVSRLASYLDQGSFTDFRHSDHTLPPIIVGSSYLDSFGLRVEDGNGVLEPTEKVRLSFGKLREDGGELAPIVIDLVIVASFASHLPYFDSLTVFIPIEQCRYLLDLNPHDPQANKLLVKLDDPKKADRKKDQIVEYLEEQTRQPLFGRTYVEYQEHYLNDIIATTRPIGYLIIGFSLLAGVLRMAHSSATSVQERVGDIGILRAIGFPRTTIMQVYLLEAGVIGLAGGLLGLGLGYLIVHLLSLSSLSLFSMPLSELNLWPDTSFSGGLLLLAIGVGVISVCGFLFKLLGTSTAGLMRSD